MLCYSDLGLVLVKADFGEQVGPFHLHPGPAEDPQTLTTDSSKLTVQSQSQAACIFGLHNNLFTKGPDLPKLCHFFDLNSMAFQLLS